jgi:diguanylate cyclase (GGDEF)-like protein
VAWLALLAVVVAAGGARMFVARRTRRSQTRSQPPVPVEVSLPPRRDPAQILQATQNLLEAFRTDEHPTSEEAAERDRRHLINALQLVADQVGAGEAVLWRSVEDNDGRLLPVAWSRGTHPPALADSDRSLIEWSATDGKEMVRGTERAVRQMSVGADLSGLRGAVSVHFEADPAYTRSELSYWLQRHAKLLGELHDVIRTRSTLARSNRRLHAMIRAATTLQASRDPVALEDSLIRDTCVVTGAAWAILVRWDPATRTGEWGRATPDAPVLGTRVTAGQGTIVGDVCLAKKQRVISDTRPILSAREPLFHETPVASGTRSLVVVPVQRSEAEAPVGALVCGHPERGGLQEADATAARTLGAIAAAALETAWAVKDETQRARTDQLTGLANRRAFDEAFTKMINETDRYGGSSALVLLDIDFFKRVNDTHGHEAGDRVLVDLGIALSEARRTTDFVARLGGEELALLLPQTDTSGAMEVAERIRQRVAEMRVKTSAGELQITASFGVVVYHARSGNSNGLFERADKALYAAKHGGRNRVELAAGDAPWSA